MAEQDQAAQGGNGHHSPGEAARSAARRLRADGVDLYESAKSAVVDSAEERKAEAGTYFRDVAGALEAGAETLDGRGRERTASWANWLADEVSHLGESMSGRGIDELWDEAEAFARRRPAVVAGAALLVGFGLVRFLMSTAEPDEPRPGNGNGGTTE